MPLEHTNKNKSRTNDAYNIKILMCKNFTTERNKKKNYRQPVGSFHEVYSE